MNSNLYHNVLKYLYARREGEDLAEEDPWWRTSFFVTKKILFGTWDGVFTSCVMNMIGVVMFLRSGWMVGYAGIGLSLLIVSISFLVALVTIMSAVGICERCSIGKGGVYVIITHVLGGKIGGAIGILFCIGHATATALYCIGFSESMIGILHWESNSWAIPCIAIITLLVLLCIAISGVKWVIRFQLLLVVIITIAVLDFFIGSIAQSKPTAGFTGFSDYNLAHNFGCEFTDDVSFFIVFGVFFPTACGVLAGVNMSGDLKNPVENIHKGSIASLGVCGALYTFIVLLLGSICSRTALKKDNMIMEKVSQVGALFIFGLFVASLSSSLGGLVGPPRVLQRIAEDDIVPVLKPFAVVKGESKEPRNATLFIALLALMFIFIGKLNLLAPIVTMPFLTTYTIINYAYFAMAMSFDIRLKQFIKTKNTNKYGAVLPEDNRKSIEGELQPKIIDEHYGDMVVPTEEVSDVREIKDCGVNGGDDESVEELYLQNDGIPGSDENLVSDVSDFPSKVDRNELNARFCNRWLSLFVCIVCFVLSFCISLLYALGNLLITCLLFLYIRHARPDLPYGISADFHLKDWIVSLFPRKKSSDVNKEHLILQKHQNNHLPFGISMYQVTEDNTDYEHRHRKHRSSLINSPVPYETDVK